MNDSPVWSQFSAWWTPYRLAAVIFFVLFLGADISLFQFGVGATGSVLVSLILTLLSGVGALAWKRQRDHVGSNETQRSIALGMIVLHSVVAVIFLAGNFGKGSWETLAGSVLVNGQLASEVVDYYVLLEQVFTWSIGIMLAADLVALFWFMEVDTEKAHDRLLASLARADRSAQLAALAVENKKANAEYLKYADRLAQLRGLRAARARLLAENEGVLPANTLQEALAGLADEDAVLAGGTPVSFPVPLAKSK